ncbi:MAG: tetratricopeptide repeat protein [Bacteroidales bacterium]
MNNKLSIFILAAIFLQACSLLRSDSESATEGSEPLSLQDSLQITSLFIEAKKEALIGNDASAVKLYKKVIDKDKRHDAALFELSRMYANFDDYDTAEQYAEKAAQYQPENPWYHKMLVDLYQRNGKLEKSRQELKWLVENEPNNLQYYQDWYNLERYLENYEEALSITKQIERITGINEQTLMQKTRLLQEMNEYARATETMEQLLLTDSTNPDYYRELIDLYNTTEQENKAIRTIKKFKKTGKDKGWADLLLAKQYQKMGETERSFRALKAAIANQKLDIDPKVNILMAYYMNSGSTGEQDEQAEILIQELTNTHPENPIAWSVKADFRLKEGNYKEALQGFEKVLELDNSRYPVWEQTLRLQLQQNENKKAIAYGKQAVNLFPEQPTLYLLKGIAHRRQEEHNKAIETLKQGLYFVSGTDLKTDFYSSLAENHHQAGNHEKSDKYFEKALQIKPDDPIILNNYAYYLALRKQNLDKALEMSNQVIKQQPNNATYLDTYGWILFQQEKYKKAEKALGKALENNGKESAAILEHYGDCMYMLNNETRAVKYWKKALEKSDAPQELEEKINTKTLAP